ncbi:MAG: hypothetical protein M1274_06345 [Actinobacteria bacterium]|nr:hypothetical protein [Actinomycetota bacterium]
MLVVAKETDVAEPVELDPPAALEVVVDIGFERVVVVGELVVGWSGESDVQEKTVDAAVIMSTAKATIVSFFGRMVMSLDCTLRPYVLSG